MKTEAFVFSSFGVNTYVVYDDTKECVIIDPACIDASEQKKLKEFIENNELKPVKLLHTHCHLDHVFGNKFVCDTYNIKPEAGTESQQVISYSTDAAKSYGINMETPYPINKFLTENDTIKFGNSELKIFHIPGHSPDSLVYYSETDKVAFVGDVLFAGSIGRTDLPGGDYDTLISGIKTKLLNLSGDTAVYPGHMSFTTIEKEKITNPFVKGL